MFVFHPFIEHISISCIKYFLIYLFIFEGWSEWTPWANCSEPCGGGFRERERECLVEGVRCICEEEKLCAGNFKVRFLVL